MRLDTSWAERMARALAGLVLAAAGAYLLLYAGLAACRLVFPFELEWMEGGAVEHVGRVRRGEPLYVPPSMEFIPFQYPPLFYYVSAVAAAATGPGFLPLRLVSVAASAVCFLAIGTLVRRETGEASAAVLAAGLFAATYRVGGAWLDIGRVDSLFLALFLCAVLVLQRAEPSVRGDVLAGLLFGLSFLAKQTALAMCLPVLALLVVTAPRRGLLVLATLGTVVAGSTAALHVASGGWYTFYVFRFPFLHPWVPAVFLSFWTADVLRPLPLASLAALSLLLPALRPAGRGRFWLAVAAGMIGGAYRSRLQTGGYDNVLLPAYAVLSILAAMAVSAVLRRAARWSPRPRAAAGVGIRFACLVQLALLAYDPRAALPSAEDARAGETVVQLLRGIDGDVLVPYHGYLAAAAGHRAGAHYMSVFDTVKVSLPESERLAEEHRRAFASRRFAAVLLDDRETYAFLADVERSYVLDREVFADPEVFFPVTGLRTRPQFLYRRPLAVPPRADR